MELVDSTAQVFIKSVKPQHGRPYVPEGRGMK
jgi:hypothetical protein